MKDIEQESQAVFGARAATYVTSIPHTDPAVLARLVKMAQLSPDTLALDVATGTGHTAFALAPYVRRVVASDLTLEMLREARTLRDQRNLLNVDFCLANVMTLPFPERAFDLVACRRAPHHFSHIEQALAEMRRVLKPGGRLVIDDRSVPEDDFVDATMNQLDVLHDPSHVREYRPGGWKAMLEKAGFVIETIETYTKHQPLTVLTRDVEAEGVREIQRIIASLTAVQKKALNVEERDGEVWTDHWFVMVAGRKVSTNSQ